ncbi:MAG: A/G-specific adenine glycosylase [Pseudomonadales bacterium]
MDWFAERLLAWFERQGRRDLPWQQPIDAYRVWVSEIMLQQTQVTTVIPYYERFMSRFPDVGALAAADLDEVLHHWTGLGYYARGRNLHRAARAVVAEHGGALPDSVDTLTALPGIGRSTAGAIAAIAFGAQAAILDGNVKRVLARFHAVPGYPGDAEPRKALWQHAEAHTPAVRVGDYTQAIMDLGATVCTRSRPNCARCPVESRCAARKAGAAERYPKRKPKRARPERAARMFVVVDSGGRCLLERRPLEGLWGGLWTPPERPAETTVGSLCDEFTIAADDVEDSRTGEPFRHTFSHFHLDIEPVFVRLVRAGLGVADRDDVCWYDAANDAGGPSIGLSAPAARLVQSIARNRSEP